jgi:cell division protein FtsB
MNLSKVPQRWLICAFFVFLVTLSLFTVFGDRGVVHLWRLMEEKEKLDERNFLLQKENESLRERIHRLRHDDLYLEKIAREELNLVRPGEVIYRFASSESEKDRARALSEFPSESPRSSEQKSRP